MDNEMKKLHELVDEFTYDMKIKLAIKKGQGYSGWGNKKNKKMILSKLKQNIGDRDWVDVANLAMMLHKFEER